MVGRAGIGLDNVDVAAATRRGVMVVNAPQSNVLSAAEHTMALLLAQARNIPQAHAALVAGRWERSRWEGVELHGKVLGVIGLGRVGTLGRPAGGRLRDAAAGLRPLRQRRTSQAAGGGAAAPRASGGRGGLPHHPPAEDPGNHRPASGPICWPGPSPASGSSTRPGAASSTRRPWPRPWPTGSVAGAALDVFEQRAGRRSRRSSSFDQVVVTPHLGASTREAQDKAGMTIAEQVQLALAGEFVPLAVNIAAAEVPEAVRPWLPLAERLGRFWAALARELPAHPRHRVPGRPGRSRHPDTVARPSSRASSAVATDEPVSFVNAPQLAEERGLEVRSTAASAAGVARSGYTNLLILRGGRHAVAGTMFGDGEPRVVMVDDHDIELPLARWMLMVHNDDRIGMVAAVATILADAGCNIVDLKLGRSAEGGTAMMALSFEHPVPVGVTAALRATARDPRRGRPGRRLTRRVPGAVRPGLSDGPGAAQVWTGQAVTTGSQGGRRCS